MSIFDINLYRKAVELMPVDKRMVRSINYLWGLIYPLQQDQIRFLNNYRTGYNSETRFTAGVYPLNYIVVSKQTVYIHLIDATAFPFYNTADTYTFGQGVINNGVAYLCNVNTSTPGTFNTSDWTLDAPPSGNWQVYLPSYLGADERVMFNGQYLVLTRALNDYFTDPDIGTCTYRPPGLYGYASTLSYLHGAMAYNKYSDIYIGNLPYANEGFLIGQRTSSSIGKTTATDGIGEDSYPFVQPINFTIYVPNRIITNTSKDAVTQFVNKIIPAGITFTVTPY